MFKAFYPSRYEESVYSIDFDMLYKQGYRNLIFDIDNTLVCHGAPQDEKSLPFLKGLMEKGFKIVFLSNNKEPRVKMFNDPLGAMYIFKGGKPSKAGYLRAVEMMQGDVNNTLFIGDQLFTDIWGANNARISSILVKPIDKHEEIQIVLKRYLEKIVLGSYKRFLKKKGKFGLIGNPVKHSKSPLIHNTFAGLRGDNLNYELFLLEKSELKGFLEKAYKDNVKGLNVTVPHKENVIPYLCGISDTAKKIGAVNTLKHTKNGYFGINTDVSGLERCFREENLEVLGRDCVLLGAGGAAKGAAAALFNAGAKTITIINRTYEKAVSLSKNLNEAFETDKFKYLSLDEIDSLPDGIFVIQTTSSGLKGEDALITADSFYKKLYAAIEIVPIKSTDFSKRCEKENVRCYDGFGMLLNQAVDAYEYWNNCVIDKEHIDIVREKLKNA